MVNKLQKLVNEYCETYGKQLDRFLQYYPRLMSRPEKLIHDIAWGRTANGKIHRHQWRVRRKTKETVEKLLKDKWEDIMSRDTLSFEDLMNIFMPIKGVGQLYAYDAALRLGECFGVKPEKVYLHRGALDGAKALLGRDKIRGRTYVNMEELPLELQCLAPYHVENFLCIYKEKLVSSNDTGDVRSCYNADDEDDSAGEKMMYKSLCKAFC